MPTSKKINLFFIFLLVFEHSLAQKHDYHFSYGYSPTNDTASVYGNCLIDFNESPPLIYKTNLNMEFSTYSATCSDSSGNLLFYTNGIRIFNAQRELIENGDTINPGPKWIIRNQYNLGYLGPPPVVVPDPGGGNRYYLFHVGLNQTNQFQPCYLTHIDMEANNGDGSVLSKNVILSEQNSSEWAAVKHANGRDWWVLGPDAWHPIILRYLVTPEGVIQQDPQIIDSLPVSDLNSSAAWTGFSPNGQYFQMSLGGDYFALFDFDRCSGLLGNQRIYPEGPNDHFGITCFSANSRYVYVNSTRIVTQWDLYQDTLDWPTLDTIQQVDFQYASHPYFSVRYGAATQMPDGSIWYNPYYTTRFFSIIRRSDLPGSACDLENSVFSLRNMEYAVHNFPNYRLGVMAGSGCDTLPRGPRHDEFIETSYEGLEEQRRRSMKQIENLKPVSSIPDNSGSPEDNELNLLYYIRKIEKASILTNKNKSYE